ncbi:MAG: 5-bromo-4-chloroindolyl phosphate hydrolysis family protein [Rhodospirillaceae bacterium]
MSTGTVDEAPALPVREIGGGLVSSAVVLVAYGLGENPVYLAALLGLVAYIGWRLAIGTDATKAEVVAALGHDPEAAAKALRDAHGRVVRIRQADVDIPCPELSERLETLAVLGEEVLALLQRDTSKVERAWRFTDRYLEGAATVSERYADVHRLSNDPNLTDDYRDFLVQMEQTFRKQKDALIRNDVLDLDVEIKVLTRQMEAG